MNTELLEALTYFRERKGYQQRDSVRCNRKLAASVPAKIILANRITSK